MGKWLRPRRTVRRTLVLDKSDVSGEPTKTSIQAANLRARGRRRANPAQSQRIPEFTILPCQMLPATKWEQPIQRLAFGIMSTALSDSRINRHQYGLRLWLRSYSNAPFSFFGICEILGLDVQAARDALIARIAMRRRNPSRSSLPGLLIARPRVL